MIEGFAGDEANEAKIALRATPEEVDSILEGRHRVVRNKRNRAGDLKVIGRAYTGRILTVIVAPTDIPGVWRPVNVWPSDREELADARRGGII